MLLLLALACAPADPDAGGDGGALDGGALDGGALDGGALDGGALDGGADGGALDGGADGGGEATLSVYLLTGQSNSLGTTQFEGDTAESWGPGEDPADALTAFYWSNVSAANTGWPPVLYGDAGGALQPLQVQQGGGADPAFWGPEFGLARALAAAGEEEVLIVKASRGGGGNTYWSSAAFAEDPASGHMWGHLVEVSTQAVGLADRPLALRGLLYVQGESNSEAEAALAGERLALLIDDVTALWEGLAPGSTADLYTVVGEIAASGSTGARALTTQQQRRLAEGDPAVGFVDTADLPLKEDGIHFGRDAKLEIGRRMAEALRAGG